VIADMTELLGASLPYQPKISKRGLPACDEALDRKPRLTRVER
jgi:hypothetical protein